MNAQISRSCRTPLFFTGAAQPCVILRPHAKPCTARFRSTRTQYAPVAERVQVLERGQHKSGQTAVDFESELQVLVRDAEVESHYWAALVASRTGRVPCPCRALVHEADIESRRWAVAVERGAEVALLRRSAELEVARQHQQRTRVTVARLKHLLDHAKQIAHENHVAQFAEEVYMCGRQDDENASQECTQYRDATKTQLQGMELLLTRMVHAVIGLVVASESKAEPLPPVRPTMQPETATQGKPAMQPKTAMQHGPAMHSAPTWHEPVREEQARRQEPVSSNGVIDTILEFVGGIRG